MRMMPRMSRFLCARLLALAFTGALITSCGGNPPPRPPRAIPTAAGLQPVHIAAVPKNAPPPVVAQSAIVIDVVSGRVLYAKNADVPRAVASTQKIVTALCVLDAGDIDKPVTIQSIDGACEPTNLNLKPGEVYPRRELTKVLMVKSANDVARPRPRCRRQPGILRRPHEPEGRLARHAKLEFHQS